MPTIKIYFSKNPMTTTPFLYKTMSMIQYMEILRYLHFALNDGKY